MVVTAAGRFSRADRDRWLTSPLSGLRTTIHRPVYGRIPSYVGALTEGVLLMSTYFRGTGRRVALAISLALLLGGLVAVGYAPRVSADVAVTIQNFAFMPTPLTVPVGTTVT